MFKGSPSYTITKLIPTLLMLLALAWLTVSLPYVYSFQQQQKKVAQSVAEGCEAADDSNPLANTTEEKSETSVTTVSEYLHELQLMDHSFEILANNFKFFPTQVYFEYHGDLVSPPPDALFI